MKKNNFKIMRAKIDEKIYIEHSYIEYVKFDYIEGVYGWLAISNKGRYIFPSKSQYDVKTFKTLGGAKRNFIRNYLTK